MHKVIKAQTACIWCGKPMLVSPSRIAQGRGKFCSKSCSVKHQTTRHGHSKNKKQSKTYNTWASMIQRCTNPKNVKYSRYGASGITVCSEWMLFDNFLRDMGERPENTTIDRIDGTKGYFKKNCRWATPKQQQRNLTNNVHVTFGGQTYILADLAKKLNLDFMTLRYRIKNNWPEHMWSKPTKKGTLRAHLACA